MPQGLQGPGYVQPFRRAEPQSNFVDMLVERMIFQDLLKRALSGKTGQADFENWYQGYSNLAGLNPDPYDPRHSYDYRGWYDAMLSDPVRYMPRIDPVDGYLHGSSEFKAADHPNRFINVMGRVRDTKSK